MKYSDKLKDPRWQKKRLEVFQRENFTCQCCGTKERTLHVHHLVYCGRDPWDAPMEALESLCDECHDFREQFNELGGGRTMVSTKLCRRFVRFSCWMAGRIKLGNVGEQFALYCRYMDEEIPVAFEQQADQIAAEGL